MSSTVSSAVANQLRFVNTYGNQQNRICGTNQYQEPVNWYVPSESPNNNKSKKVKPGKFDYSIDDGKISKGDKLKNFIKGVFSPVTSLFKSPGHFILGAATIAGSVALLSATGGAAAPVMVALGLGGGALRFVTSMHKASHAKTDEEARQAWRGMGQGAVTVAGSIFAAKPALKAAGAKGTENMGSVKSAFECFKQIPVGIKNSYAAFKRGEAIENLRNLMAMLPQPKGKVVPPADPNAPVVEPPVSGARKMDFSSVCEYLNEFKNQAFNTIGQFYHTAKQNVMNRFPILGGNKGGAPDVTIDI